MHEKVKSDYIQIKPNTEIGAAAHAWNLLCATIYKILKIVLHMHNISNSDSRPYRIHFLANKTIVGSAAWSSELYSRA